MALSYPSLALHLSTICLTTLALGTTATAQTKKSPIPIGNSASRGPTVAPVTMVIISDFQCHYCAKSTKVVEGLIKANPQNLRVVFKHLPLAFHRQAKQAAWAAEAARRQKAFWQMHDKLYAGYKTFSQVGDMDALMLQYANELGLDFNTFKKDYQDKTLRQSVANDMQLAKSLGVRGTPTFFINGAKISGAQRQYKMQRVIDRELKKANAAIKSGVLIKDVYAHMTAVNLKLPRSTRRASVALPPAKATMVPIGAHNPVRGSTKKALVTVVMFNNAQDIYGARAYQTIDKARKQFKNKEIRLIFKHKLQAFYKHDRAVHRALIAAQQQKAFWTLYDAMVQSRNQWHHSNDIDAFINTTAKKVGLNMKQFERDLRNPTLLRDINDDRNLAKRFNIRVTPTIYVNGMRLKSYQPDAVKTLFKEQVALAKQLQSRKKSLKGERLYKALVKANAQRFSSFGQKAKNDARAKIKPYIKTAPTMGPSRAPLTIVEFTDLQCLYCAKSNVALRAALKSYKGKIRLVTFHQPLPFHARAEAASLAAIAAQAQGKFWEMQALMFENVSRLDEPEIFLELAGQLKLNMKKFQADMSAASTKKRLNDDRTLAKSLGVVGAPVFFFNGKKVSGSIGKDAIKREIDEALKAKK